MKIAVLMTCYNRRELTLRCLHSLFACELPKGCELNVYLNDDGSIDGTGDAVKSTFRDVRVLKGTGSDYWCGGMRRAWNAALADGEKFDYFLWANDDVVFLPCALKELLSVAGREDASPLGLVCGVLCDPVSGELTYGGRDEKRLLKPNGKVQQCRYVHGNAVLVPWGTYEKIGIFDKRWTHGLGDTDYGLCCIEAGLRCVVTTRYIGTCEQHRIRAPWFSCEVPFRTRFSLMFRPVGGNFREYVVFRRKHYPVRWIFDAMKFAIQVVFPRPFSWYSSMRK